MRGTVARLKALLEVYGAIALVVWLGIFALTVGGFAVAIGLGFAVEGAAETAGTLGAAYLATQLTKPVRVVATVALTPIVARMLRRAPSPVEPEGRMEGQ